MGRATNTPARVLVVDDNTDTAQLLLWLLTSFGHDVRVAHAGAEAIEQAGVFRPDAVLLDVGLPDIDGYEVARRLRSHPDHARTLLIAATGHNREQDRLRANEVGFDHYLVKPFNPGQVDQLLTRGLEREAVSA